MTNQEIRDFLQNAIDENRVMLFMKGTPDEPRCGFSMRTSAALNALGVKYAAMDILPDPRIPEELSGLSRLPPRPRGQRRSRRRWASRTAWASPRAGHRWRFDRRGTSPCRPPHLCNSYP